MGKSQARKTKKRPTSKSRPLAVGDRVSFMFGVRRVTGTIVEDRGNIGVGGRQLVGIRMRVGLDEERVIEMPAEEVTRRGKAA